MTPRTSLRWRLRDATSDAHARLDAMTANAFDDRMGYAAFLRGMRRFVATAATVTGDAMLVPSLAALTDDLAALDVDAVERDMAPRADDATALGWRYVVAGASLGARVLLPKAHALGFDARGARYLALQATGTSWRDLQPELDVPAHTARADAAVAGALAAFACARAAMADAFETVPA